MWTRIQRFKDYGYETRRNAKKALRHVPYIVSDVNQVGQLKLDKYMKHPAV